MPQVKYRLTTQRLMAELEFLRSIAKDLMDKIDELTWKIQLEGVDDDRPKPVYKDPSEIPF
jgi:hypothetical protein